MKTIRSGIFGTEANMVLNIDYEEICKKSVEQYKENIKLYEQFTDLLKDTIEKLLETKEVRYDHIAWRTKDIDSFAEKIARDGKHYTNPLIDVTDLCGIRIVVNSLSDLNPIVDLITTEFKVDELNSINKSDKLEINEFGYLSTHLVVSINDDRRKLPEYEKFADLKAEIQIRTVLQHAWASIEHKINYKKSYLPKEEKRTLYNLAAVLELVDKEFQHSINSYELKKAEYKEKIEKNEYENIELNGDSLYQLLSSERVLTKLNEIKIDRLCIDTNDKTISYGLVKLLKKAKINSIDKVFNLISDKELIKNLEKLVDAWKIDKSDENLRLNLNKLLFLRLLVYFSLNEDERKSSDYKNLITDKFRQYLEK